MPAHITRVTHATETAVYPTPSNDEEFAAYLARKHLKPVPGHEPRLSTPPNVTTTRPKAKPAYWPYKSATEQRYAMLLDTLRYERQVGWWWYEPCKGLYLTETISYTPDFLVQWGPDPCRTRLEFHEVKGAYIYEKDWLRAKMAAAKYPCFRFVLAQWDGGEWHYQDIPGH